MGSAAERWEALVGDVLGEGSATYGNEGGPERAFGCDVAQDRREDLRDAREGAARREAAGERVEELVEAGVGQRFDPGHGRIQKEWLSVTGGDPSEWRSLATESEAFVARRRGDGGREPLPGPPRPRRPRSGPRP